MKKFTKVVLILAAVCFVLGISITAVAAVAGGAKTVRDRLGRVGQSIEQSRGTAGRFDPDDLDDIFDDDDDWDDRYDDDWDDALEHGALHHEDSHHSSQNGTLQPGSQSAGSQSRAGSEAQSGSQSSSGQQKNPAAQGSYGVTGQLEVEVDAGRLQIVEGDIGDNIQVQVNSDEIQLWTELEGNERKLTFRPAKSGIVGLSDDAYAVLTLPRGYTFDKVSLDAEAGSIKADRINARQLELSADAGNIQVEGGAAQVLEADCGLGTLSFAGAVASRLEADCELGSMELHLDGKKEDFSYTLETETGSIRIQDESFSGRSKKSLTNKGSSKSASLECEAGTITVDFTD